MANCSLACAFVPRLEVGEFAARGQRLNIHTVALDFALLAQLVELTHNVLGEAEFTRDEHLLAAGELELGATEGLLGLGHILGLGTDGHKDRANVHTGRFAQGLSVGVSHTGLQSIGTGAREHLVDADHVPGVHSNANVEAFLSCVDLHVFVGSNAGSLKCFRSDLLLLVGDQMHAAGEEVPVGSLPSAVVHTNLGVRHTTIEARLRVRLVLLVSVATRWSTSHFYKII